MQKKLIHIALLLLMCGASLLAQTNTWGTHYVTLDDANNGTGDQTTSVAAFEANRFVGIVAQTPSSPILENLFDLPGNYLVAYWDADSVNGRVNSPINGNFTEPFYNVAGQYTSWESGLDNLQLQGAYCLASGNGADRYVYVANNDTEHNILVFKLDATGVVSTDFRMITGSENIFAIEVDDNGYVYVCNYEGEVLVNDEIKVYAGIGQPGTTWGDFVGHNDAPVATINLPEGTYLGMTVSNDGSAIFVSHSSARTILKYTGSPTGGYTLDPGFSVTLAADDTVANGGNGTPTFLGLAYLNDPPIVFAAIDTFLASGGSGGYPYGRIYSYNAATGAPLDTVDVAEWNLQQTGDYSSGSNDGRAGGYTSLVDVDVEQSEKAVYSVTYYGWAVEKWEFDGTLTGVEPLSYAAPQAFSLKANYPNPFNPSTTIEFDLQQAAFVTLDVFNMLGQKVATLVNGQLPAGSFKTTFDAASLPSGIYIYRLAAGDFSAVRKMTLIR